MRYLKPPLTFEAQADLLIARGLEANRDLLISRLKTVNYYRLSGYLYPFRRPDDTFVPDTSLETVWNRYTFDRFLRLLIMDAIERVEVAFRTQIIYNFAHNCGSFAYLDMTSFPGLSEDKHGKWLAELRLEIIRSREPFIEHFRIKYGDCHTDPPVWMLAEVMSFGKVLTMFCGVCVDIQKKIAAEYGVPDEVMKSWFFSLNAIRNICAHHGRLWNRELGMKPKMPNPRKYPDWHHPVEVANRRIFGILTILWYLLQRIEPASKWKHELHDLLSRYPDIPKKDMGFPEDWKKSPIWKGR